MWNLQLRLTCPFTPVSTSLTPELMYFHKREPDAHVISKVWTAICKVGKKTHPVRSCFMFALALTPPVAAWLPSCS